MMDHKTNRALRTALVVIFSGVSTACAGGDTPARDGDLLAVISGEYGTGQVGANGGSGNGGSGNSGNQGGSSGDGGSASGESGSSSEGGSASGDGGSDSGNGGDGGGEPSDCDGFMILQSSCGSPTCHGAGTGFTDFAASEATAAEWVGEKAQAGCNSNPAVVFDPDDPGQSLVVLKLSASPPCGGPMPLGSQGNTFSAEQIACIQDFISSLGN